MTRRGWLPLAAAVLSCATLVAQGPPSAAIPTGSNLLIGRVTDADTGAPIASAVVSMSIANATGRASSQRVLTDAHVDIAKLILPAALGIPRALIACLSAVGHVTNPQATVARSTGLCSE